MHPDEMNPEDIRNAFRHGHLSKEEARRLLARWMEKKIGIPEDETRIENVFDVNPTKDAEVEEDDEL